MESDQNPVIPALAAFEEAVSRLPAYNAFMWKDVPLPLEVETALCDVWCELESLSECGWSTLRSWITRRCAGHLLTCSLRMAVLAVRTSEKRYVFDGLMGLVMDDDSLDQPDVCVFACVLYDAAVRTGADANELIQRARRYAKA
jgi:hypothetical protein